MRAIPKWTFGAGLSYQNSIYQREFALGVQTRKDDYLALDLSASYAIDLNWQLRDYYQRVEQKSSIGFFAFNRDQLSVKLRYDFK